MNKDNIKIIEINIELESIFEKIKNKQTQIEMQSPEYFKYLKVLSMVYYCIKSEIAFPAVLNNEKFEWEVFEKVSQTLSDQEILKIIS